MYNTLLDIFIASLTNYPIIILGGCVPLAFVLAFIGAYLTDDDITKAEFTTMIKGSCVWYAFIGSLVAFSVWKTPNQLNSMIGSWDASVVNIQPYKTERVTIPSEIIADRELIEEQSDFDIFKAKSKYSILYITLPHPPGDFSIENLKHDIDGDAVTLAIRTKNDYGDEVLNESSDIHGVLSYYRVSGKEYRAFDLNTYAHDALITQRELDKRNQEKQQKQEEKQAKVDEARDNLETHPIIVESD